MTKRLSAILRLALVSLVFSTLTTRAHEIDIDLGGSLDKYWYDYQKIKATGESVIVKRKCESACTLVLSIIPLERICVAEGAEFRFHAPRYHGTQQISRLDAEILFRTYPDKVQKWIVANRALESLQYKTLRGAELEAIVNRC